MSASKALVYAELLANIRQISIVAALDPPCNATTSASLSPNGFQIIISHEGEVTTTDLPGQVAANGSLQKSVLGSRELSWRLPLAGALPSDFAERMQSNDVPWSAKYLGQDSEFLCRACGAVIVRNGSIKTWKDLPSENWAEMMEFWHCHKPDDHEHSHESNGASGHEKHTDAEKSLADRGYGANTKFMPRSQFALVGPTTFHFTFSDCTGIQTSYSTEEASEEESKEAPGEASKKAPEDKRINCGTCGNYLGHVDHQTEGLKLYKWTLQLSSSSSSTMLSPTLPSAPLFIASQLADILHSQCASRMLLSSLGVKRSETSRSTTTLLSEESRVSSVPCKSGSSTERIRHPLSNSNFPSSLSPSSSTLESAGSTSTFLSLWILAGGLRISSSRSLAGEHIPPTAPASPPLSGTFAMKVFWKHVTEEEASKLRESTEVEELQLVPDALHELGVCLHDSAALLPPSMRKFQTWNVGLLERYEEQAGGSS